MEKRQRRSMEKRERKQKRISEGKDTKLKKATTSQILLEEDNDCNDLQPKNKAYFTSKKKNKSEKKYKEKQNIVYILMISSDCYGISLPYAICSDEIKRCIKQSGGIWCSIFKVWRIPAKNIDLIRASLFSLIEVRIEQPPQFLRLALEPLMDKLLIRSQGKWLNYEEEHIVLKDNPLYDILYQFQKEALEFCIKQHGRILLADQMGVGKTLQSLAMAMSYYQQFPLLVICPSALKHVWKDEIGKWLKKHFHKDQVVIVKSLSKSLQLNHAKILIVSYEIASKMTGQLQDTFKMVICDEAHYLKNADTKRSESLIPFLKSRKRLILLTGTPALAKPKELFNLMAMLRPDIFHTFKEFGERYCELKMNPWTFKWEYDGSKNLSELHYLLKANLMIRRMKCHVLNELPEKQRQIIMMQSQRTIVKQIRQLIGEAIPMSKVRSSEKLLELFLNKNKFESDSDEESNAMMRCYQLTAIAKLHSVKEYIGSLLENDIKILIFAHHKVVLDEIELFLQKNHWLSIRIDGDVSPELRKKRVDLFQTEFGIKAAVLSITAAGIGYTLTAASTVVFAELHWTPAMLMQAEDRSHRIGQQNSVNIHYLIGEDTLDPLLLRHLERKVQTVGKVLNGENQNLHIQILPKGEIGDFVIPVRQSSIKKSAKITDYFKSSQESAKKKENTGKQASQDEEEMGESLNERENESESLSEDSYLIRMSRKKKKELQIDQ